MKARALRILLAEDTISPAASDGMDRVASLVAPLVSGESGGQIDPNSLAMEINAVFNWAMTTDVIAVVLQRLAANGVVERRRIGDRMHYFYAGSLGREGEASATLQLCELFRSYCGANRTISTQINEEIKKICDTDESILVLISNILPILDDFWTDTEELLNSPQPQTYPNWQRTLVAEFLLHVGSSAEHRALVGRLSDILLIRDVVTNYQIVDASVKRSALTVVLDTPLALSLIGVSGSEQQRNAKAAVDGARSIGCKMAIFPSTLEEMSLVLRSMLANVGWDRRGASADAIRRNDVDERVVRDVASNPEKYATLAEISILARGINSFPNEKQFLSDDLAGEFYRRISWTQRKL